MSTRSDDALGSRPSLPAARPSAGASAVRGSVRPPPASEPGSAARFQGEDFLFHLYRGSELLQDNCVEEAKEELERALRVQPLDVEGQGLLGVTYFRLGLYPRAIEIYRQIIAACPGEITPKLNLALCYLKTGQPAEARDLLQDVIRRAPDHRRALGYLGLAFERLGEYSSAQQTFEQAGQPTLARRMQQLLDQLSEAPSEPNPPREDVRRAAADAVEELDAAAGPAPFEHAPAEAELAGMKAGRWRAHEPGEELVPSALPRRPSLRGRSFEQTGVNDDLLSSTHPTAGPLAGREPWTSDALVSARRLEPPAGRSEHSANGLVFVRLREAFAVRSERVRAMSSGDGGLKPSALRRRVRGREVDEPFGGTGSNWVTLEGQGLLVLEPSGERELQLLRLHGEFVYLREVRLVGFDYRVRHENGRLPAADPGPVAMVQLSGEGLVVFEARRAFGALRVSGENPLTVRAASVLGWTGRLLGQTLPTEQAPQLGSAFVSFSGDGAVLVDDP